MKFGLQGLVAVSGLMMAAAALAQVPADAPSGTTGLCKDGTYVSAETKKGACKGHKGIKTWYAADTKKTPAADAKGAAPAAAATPAATPAPAAASAATPAAAPATTKSKTAMPATAAPGGGPGLVWLNTSTKVYHCQGDKWYGKTKAGEYLSEADAKAKGAHAEGGKACS
jgi:hypothetical protein